MSNPVRDGNGNLVWFKKGKPARQTFHWFMTREEIVTEQMLREICEADEFLGLGVNIANLAEQSRVASAIIAHAKHRILWQELYEWLQNNLPSDVS